MAVTEFQRGVLSLLAPLRMEMEGSYVAGGLALNQLLGSSRLPRGIDLFHDTREALARSWEADAACLRAAGYGIRVVRERPSFVEAVVSKGPQATALQWVIDSAFRFFPLRRDPLFGAVLHPFDLATNKMLALVGRNEVRDWVDAVACARDVQPLGLLFWAAVGKDPGYSVQSLRERAARIHHSAEEVALLSFEGEAPDAGEISALWHAMLSDVSPLTDALPPGQIGTCVCNRDGSLFRGDAGALAAAAAEGSLLYRRGRIRGVWPELAGPGER